jgi:hypothetical protein
MEAVRRSQPYFSANSPASSAGMFFLPQIIDCIVSKIDQQRKSALKKVVWGPGRGSPVADSSPRVKPGVPKTTNSRHSLPVFHNPVNDLAKPQAAPLAGSCSCCESSYQAYTGLVCEMALDIFQKLCMIINKLNSFVELIL